MTTKQKFSFVLAAVLANVSQSVMAQGGATAVTAATTEVSTYMDPVGTLIIVIGGVVALVGGYKVFQKLNGGDKDVNKDIMQWAGSCVFLIVVGIFVKAVFGI